MPIHFSEERWAVVRDTYAKWWDGRIHRPIVNYTIRGAQSGAPVLSQANVCDLARSPEDIVDAWDAQLSGSVFLGDAFPYVSLDPFGPGVLSAFAGAKLDNSSGSVWFFPKESAPIERIHVAYDADNPWVRRIKAIYEAGIRKWGNTVCMGMPDLGGVLDAAAVFRGTEDLLMDLYDAPGEVLRLCREIEIAWWTAYDDFSRLLRGAGIGYTDWSGIYSDEPSYMLQCDFAYMIGGDMFQEFVLPTLKRDCERLAHPAYHLDGVGQLKHLSELLAIPNLRAVQWVQGDGKPSGMHWLDVYRQTAEAGKRVQAICSMDELIELAPLVRESVYVKLEGGPEDRSRAEAQLKALLG